MEKLNLRFLARQLIKVSLILLLSLSYETKAASLLVGGARADIAVDIEGLSKHDPQKKCVGSFNLTLPKDYVSLGAKDKGRCAQDFSHKCFLSLTPVNERKSPFSVVACNGTYEVAEDNGYDGLYVVLDDHGKVAEFGKSGQLIKAGSDGSPIIIINESKAYKDGKLRFGKGIKLESEGDYAKQMSEAWVRIVSHNILKQKREGKKCAITDKACKDTSRRYAACETVNDAILKRIIGGSDADLRSIFRIATVLGDDGKWSIYALGSDEGMVNKTEALLKKLFSKKKY